MSNPVFSVITPTAGRPLLLKRNILSIINQTFGNYEHIIIDDANDQETANIVSQFNDKRIVFLRNSANKGPSGSRNTGIKASRGEFISFLDDDDEFMPQMLDRLYNHFSGTNNKNGFVWTGILKIKDTTEGEIPLSTITWSSPFLTTEEGLIAATTIGNGFGICIKRNCIDTIGLYDESLAFGEDTELLFRLVENFDFETIPEILVKKHEHESSQLSDQKHDIVRLEQRERILEKHYSLLRKYPKLFQIHFKDAADLCYRLKLKSEGRRNMFAVIKYTPFKILNITDLIFYELIGINTINLYLSSPLRKFVTILKRKFNHKHL